MSGGIMEEICDIFTNKNLTEFSVMLFGSFNPSMHHPMSYAYTNLYNQEDILSIDYNSLLCTKDLSSFKTKGNKISVECSSRIWAITITNKIIANITSGIRTKEQALDIVSKYISSILRNFTDTATAIGIKAEYSVGIKSKVLDVLGSYVQKGPFGLDHLDPGRAEIGYTRKYPNKLTSINIRNNYITSRKEDNLVTEFLDIYVDCHSLLPDHLEYSGNKDINRQDVTVLAINLLRENMNNVNDEIIYIKNSISSLSDSLE